MSSTSKIDGLPSRVCEECPVRCHAICQVFNDNELLDLSSFTTHRRLIAGQLLWAENEEVCNNAIIKSGSVKLFKSFPDGKQHITGLLFASDFLGHAFASNSHYRIIAATEVMLCSFPKKDFQELLEKNKNLTRELLKKVEQDFDEYRCWMSAMNRKSALEKVASLLLLLVKKRDCEKLVRTFSDSEKPTFLLPLTQLEIANYLGATHETISRCFSKLKAQNLINMVAKNVVEICDLKELESLSGQS